MDHTKRCLLVALLTAWQAYAQATTDPNAGVVTSYYSVCPTGSSTTVTLPLVTSTQGMGPGLVTVMPQATTILGKDGSVTIYNAYEHVMPHVCDGGVCGATYTLYDQCPCTAGPKTITIDECPSGFTTTAVACTACAARGGPATVTVTTPIPTGPYATQSPAMGPPAASPAAVVPTAPAAPVAPAASAPPPVSAANGGTGGAGSGGRPSSATISPAAPVVNASNSSNSNGNGNGNGNNNAATVASAGPAANPVGSGSAATPAAPVASKVGGGPVGDANDNAYKTVAAAGVAPYTGLAGTTSVALTTLLGMLIGLVAIVY